MPVLLLVALACGPARVDLGGDDSASPPMDSDPDPGDTPDPPPVINGVATVSANPDDRFAAIVEVTLDHDADVHVRYGDGALDHATPVERVTAGQPHRIPVRGLRAGRSFRLEAVAEEDGGSWASGPLAYATEPLPAGWPACTASFTADEAEYTRDEVVCSNSRLPDWGHVYTCWDRWGEPVMGLRTPADNSLFSMTPLPDGGWASTSYNYTELVTLDRFGAQTGRYSMLSFPGTRFQHDWVDVHEVTPIVEGDWAGALVFVTATYEWFSDGSYRLGNGLIVWDPSTEEVLWDWSFHGALGDGVAMDPKLPYDRWGYGDYAEDWTHLNSILHGVDEDGRDWFLLSLKSQDWVVKLRPDTDALEWALGVGGDFRLVDDVDAARPVDRPVAEWQYHQHGMWMVSDVGDRMRLMLFDNGYPRQDESGYRFDWYWSRVVEYELDETTGLVELVFDWGESTYGAPDWFFSSSRSNARLLPDGERVIFLSGEQILMREVAYPEGGERWEMSCPWDDEGMYRVHWFPDLYQTDWIFSAAEGMDDVRDGAWGG